MVISAIQTFCRDYGKVAIVSIDAPTLCEVLVSGGYQVLYFKAKTHYTYPHPSKGDVADAVEDFYFKTNQKTKEFRFEAGSGAREMIDAWHGEVAARVTGAFSETPPAGA